MQEYEQLTEIGFTKNEALTYIALLELGEAQTGILCERLHIPSSHIYAILKSLQEKGVISYKIANNIKVFQASDPESLNVLYLKRQEELEKHRIQIQDSIKNLKKIPKKNELISNYKYYEGIHGIKSAWLEFQNILDAKYEFLAFISVEKGFIPLNAFYMEFHKERAKRKVRQRMIMPKGLTRYMQERIKSGYFKGRFLDTDNEAEFMVHGDLTMIQYINTKTPRAFIIKDKIFAQMFTVIFNQLWEKAKQ